MTIKELDTAKSQATLQLVKIIELMAELEDASKTSNDAKIESAHDRILNDPLEVSVRSGWHHPGEKAEDVEFLILLCTGGPAVRLIGELSQFNEPEAVRMEYQDWFTPWIEFPLTSEQQNKVLAYCAEFYFGA